MSHPIFWDDSSCFNFIKGKAQMRGGLTQGDTSHSEFLIYT